ncbi:MAG: hypothetical protein M3R26_02885 [Actinomycetota bacterium]|nr:hypothetical protein [Actinomycetota bacterium]MDQ2981254.1 hypothetical protein [Actinomycetota bacterium]
MSRVRIAVAVLLAAAGGVAVLLATTADAASGKRFRYTHRVVVVGQYVDHWTVSDPNDCGLVGDGTVTVNFRLTKAAKVRLELDPFYGAEGAMGKGSWVLGSPAGGGRGDLPAQPAAGTLTLVDNTAPRLPADGHECEPPEKADCGTGPLARALSRVNGYSRHLLIADLLRVEFWQKGGSGRSLKCGIGQTTVFTDRNYSGGNRNGQLLIRMPSPSTVAHRRVVRVTAMTHKRTVNGCGSRLSCTDDVTRRVTVTFTRL